jgi:hypothetical protein
MNLIPPVLLVSMLFALPSVNAFAPDTLFVTPTGPIACRPVTVTPADSADVMLEFIDGMPDVRTRQTLIAFQTAGTPLYMTVNQTELQPAKFETHNIAVRFGVLGEYLHVERPMRNGQVVRDSAGVFSTTILTTAEMAKSKELAMWFWEHRCNRDPGGS